MESNQALSEYLRLAKITELEEKYSNYGFDVAVNYQSGSYTFDIFIQKNRKQINETKYIMVKTGHYSLKQIVLVSAMREYVEKTLGSEFELIIANPPRKKEIGFDEFERAFSRYLNDVFLDKDTSENEEFLEYLEKLKGLSDNTLIESVTDIEIDILDVRDGEIWVRGVASLNLVLQFDNEDEENDTLRVIDSYSCSFDINVYDVFNYNYNGPTIEIEEFDINFPDDD